MTLDPHTQALKVAARDLVRAVGGQEAGVGFCRPVRPSTLSAYGNSEKPEFMPVDVVRDLEAVTRGTPGAPHVTRALARQSGHALVPLPGAKPEGVSWPKHLACCARESGDVVAGLAAALADGKVRAGEARCLVRETDDAIQRLVDLRAALQVVAADTS